MAPWSGGSRADYSPDFGAFACEPSAFFGAFGADGRGRQSRNDGDGATGHRAGVTGGCDWAMRGGRG